MFDRKWFVFIVAGLLLVVAACGPEPNPVVTAATEEPIVSDKEPIVGPVIPDGDVIWREIPTEPERINNCGAGGGTVSKNPSITVLTGHSVEWEYGGHTGIGLTIGDGIVPASVNLQAALEGRYVTTFDQGMEQQNAWNLPAAPNEIVTYTLMWREAWQPGVVRVTFADQTISEIQVNYRVRIQSEIVDKQVEICDDGEAETPTPTIAAPVSDAVPYGALLFEENFDPTSTWSLDGNRIEDGNLIMKAGYDAVPAIDTTYSDFIFESRVFIPESGSVAFYLRHQRPPCPQWNCSIQVVLYYSPNEQSIVARRFLGDSVDQQFDIAKSGLNTLLRRNQWNDMVVVMRGNEYLVYLNNTQVMAFNDDTYSSGSFVLDNAGPGDVMVDYVHVYGLP